MNKLLLFLFFFNSIILNAQNWSAINATDKFNYKLDNDKIITSTIWADSVQVINGDTIYFLNRITCDSCFTFIGGPDPFCDTCYGLKNQPDFLQRKIVISPSGILNFRDSANIIINPKASPGENWLFDSTQNISASVISIEVDSIFGNADSIKTILLSTGDTVKLSLNFGIVQFPNNYGQNSYYRLVGIEGRNLGEHVPRFADFFNLEVGDKFEYHVNGSLGADCGLFEIFQYTITSKQISGDSIIYQTHGYFDHWEPRINFWNLCGTHNFGAYGPTLIFVDSSDHFSNKYNKQYFNLSYHIPNLLVCFDNDTAYDHVREFIDSNDVVGKSFGFSIIDGWPRYYTYLLLNRNSDILYADNNVSNGIGAYSSTYKVGLGQTDFAFAPCFEGWDEKHLVAYRKGNDSVGVFTPENSLLLGIKFQEKINYSIYPNPADEILNLICPDKSKSELILYDVQGKIILKKIYYTDNIFLNVKEIKNGFYFLILTTNKDKITKKIIIQHE